MRSARPVPAGVLPVGTVLFLGVGSMRYQRMRNFTIGAGSTAEIVPANPRRVAIEFFGTDEGMCFIAPDVTPSNYAVGIPLYTSNGGRVRLEGSLAQRRWLGAAGGNAIHGAVVEEFEDGQPIDVGRDWDADRLNAAPTAPPAGPTA